MTDYPSPRTCMVHFCSPTIPPSPSRGEGTKQRKQNAFTFVGFTLAELLIALAILGVIATFTIPKILDSGSDSKFNSLGKEAISIVSGAFQVYKINNTVSASTSIPDLTPYMNYVSIDTSTTIDSVYSATTETCSQAGWQCLALHGGGKFMYQHSGVGANFADTANTSTIFLYFDPDGKVTTTGAANTPGKSIEIYLYTNGRILTRGTLLPNSYQGTGGPYGADSSREPPWFSWSN